MLIDSLLDNDYNSLISIPAAVEVVAAAFEVVAAVTASEGTTAAAGPPLRDVNALKCCEKNTKEN